MSSSVSGKVAFVTGGASGIGAALAATLADRGATVWIADRRVDAAQEPAQTNTSGQAAADSGQPAPSAQGSGTTGASSQAARTPHSLYRSWRRMADQEESSEPDWLSPLATTSGRIKNELRYDIWRQFTPAGSTVSTFAGGKGMEFIAAPRVQLLLGIP